MKLKTVSRVLIEIIGLIIPLIVLSIFIVIDPSCEHRTRAIIVYILFFFSLLKLGGICFYWNTGIRISKFLESSLGLIGHK